MQIINKKLLDDSRNRIAYATLDRNDYSNISAFSTDDLSNNQSIIKLNLDSNLEISSSKYITEKNNKIFENISSNHDYNKISGIYPGVFKGYQMSMNRISEANIFLLVKQAIDTISDINAKDISSEFDFFEKREWEYAFEFCLAYLARFGVEQSFNSETKRMEKTPTFTAWYKWWNEYYENIIKDNELSKLFYYHQKSCQNLDIFRPEGSFQEYLDDEILVEKTKRKKFNSDSQEKVS